MQVVGAGRLGAFDGDARRAQGVEDAASTVPRIGAVVVGARGQVAELVDEPLLVALAGVV